MSCVKLPQGLCDNISGMLAKFWWGSTHLSKGMHWMAWDKLCFPKERGGLGFRNIRGFNQALLAKQSWRMLRSPDSLVARVFKGKYFAQTDILSAELGYRPSYVWRSIVWGKELLKRGLRKRIGSGLDSMVFSDPWIPRELNFKPITPKPLWVNDLN